MNKLTKVQLKQLASLIYTDIQQELNKNYDEERLQRNKFRTSVRKKANKIVEDAIDKDKELKSLIDAEDIWIGEVRIDFAEPPYRDKGIYANKIESLLLVNTPEGENFGELYEDAINKVRSFLKQKEDAKK